MPYLRYTLECERMREGAVAKNLVWRERGDGGGRSSFDSFPYSRRVERLSQAAVGRGRSFPAQSFGRQTRPRPPPRARLAILPGRHTFSPHPSWSRRVGNDPIPCLRLRRNKGLKYIVCAADRGPCLPGWAEIQWLHRALQGIKSPVPYYTASYLGHL